MKKVWIHFWNVVINKKQRKKMVLNKVFSRALFVSFVKKKKKISRNWTNLEKCSNHYACFCSIKHILRVYFFFFFFQNSKDLCLQLGTVKTRVWSYERPDLKPISAVYYCMILKKLPTLFQFQLTCKVEMTAYIAE